MKKRLYLLLLGLSMVCGILAFAATSSTNILSEKAVVSRIRNMIRGDKNLIVSLPEGEVTQYSAENGDIVHITSFHDGKTRYEYYCCDTEKIYCFYDDSLNGNIDLIDANKQSIEMEVFDVAEYRKKNDKRYEFGSGEMILS